jgi:hypothetical protein
MRCFLFFRVHPEGIALPAEPAAPAFRAKKKDLLQPLIYNTTEG